MADLFNPADQCSQGRPTLQPDMGAPFGGVVMTPDAEPAATVVVEIEDALGLQNSTTKVDGRFTMSRHPSGLTRVRVWRDNRLLLSLSNIITLDPIVLVVPSADSDVTTQGPDKEDLHRPFWQPSSFDQNYPSVGFKTVTLIFSGLELATQDESVVVEFSPPYARPAVIDMTRATAGPVTLEVPSGVSVIHASTSQLRSHCAHLPASSKRAVPVALLPLGVISGCTVDPWGDPVAAAKVQVMYIGHPNHDPSTTFSDRQGRFHIVTCGHDSMLRATHPSAGAGSSGKITGEHEHVILKPR